MLGLIYHAQTLLICHLALLTAVNHLGNSGLGAETIRALAAHNCSEIWLAARTRSTAESTLASIKESAPKANIRIVDLDLGSFDSIKSAAEIFNNSSSRLDLLFCNAAVVTEGPLTASGYELQWGTNYVGHALLVKLLLPKMLETAKLPNADVRNVILSSMVHTFAVPKKGLDLDTVKTRQKQYSSMNRYAMSKLADIYLAKELSSRYPSIKTVAIHPGAVSTGLMRDFKKEYPLVGPVLMPLMRMVFSTAADGARNQLWAATAEGVVNGEYYNPIGKTGGATKVACDQAKAKELWEWTEKEFAEHGLGQWPS